MRSFGEYRYLFYKSLELLLRPLHRLYKFPFIRSITEFIPSVNCLLDGAGKEQELTKDVADTRQATTDSRTRSNDAEANNRVFEKDLFKQKKDVSLITTELSTANLRIA